MSETTTVDVVDTAAVGKAPWSFATFGQFL